MKVLKLGKFQKMLDEVDIGLCQEPPKESVREVINFLEDAENLQDVRTMKSLHLEKLRGVYKGKYSVRINDKWRIIMKVDTKSNTLTLGEISNHYKK